MVDVLHGIMAPRSGRPLRSQGRVEGIVVDVLGIYRGAMAPRSGRPLSLRLQVCYVCERAQAAWRGERRKLYGPLHVRAVVIAGGLAVIAGAIATTGQWWKSHGTGRHLARVTEACLLRGHRCCLRSFPWLPSVRIVLIRVNGVAMLEHIVSARKLFVAILAWYVLYGRVDRLRVSCCMARGSEGLLAVKLFTLWTRELFLGLPVHQSWHLLSSCEVGRWICIESEVGSALCLWSRHTAACVPRIEARC